MIETNQIVIGLTIIRNEYNILRSKKNQNSKIISQTILQFGILRHNLQKISNMMSELDIRFRYFRVQYNFKVKRILLTAHLININ